MRRLNAGGVGYSDTASRLWAADSTFVTGGSGYLGGSAKSTTSAVTGTSDDPLYQKYREAMTEYRFTIPNGSYQLTLRFAEFAARRAGSRVMRITIEGVDVETALDVYGAAGRAAALDKTYPATVTDGELNVVFTKVSGAYSPMVSAIEVTTNGPVATSTPIPAVTPGGPINTPTPTFTAKRANAGGTVFTDSQSRIWASDQAYAVDSWGYTGGAAKSTTRSVAGTSDDGLYQKWHENPGEYRFAVPDGTYQVTLRFAEFEVTNSSDRIIKITIEGVVVENTLSIYGAVGASTALDQTYTTSVTDGVLNIAFAQNGGRKLPILSAIAVQ